MSSFRRRIPATAEPQLPPAPPGTRIVAHTGQFVVSSGVASLDEVVGGGFPLGSLALLKLDRGTSYGNLLLRYFAAQALVDRHGLIVVTCDSDPETFVKTLPRPIDGSAVGGAEDEEDNNVGPAGLDVDDDGGLEEKPDDLKIAWRYKPVGTFSTAVKADGTGRKNVSFGTGSEQTVTPTCSAIFDITKAWSNAATVLPPELLILMEHSKTGFERATRSSSSPWVRLLCEIKTQVSRMRSFRPRLPIRLCIHNLGSPMSDLTLERPEDITQAVRFFISLRHTLQEANAIGFITMPAYLLGDSHGVAISSRVRSLERVFDAVFEVDSFAGSQRGANSAYSQDYHGLFHVHRLFRTDLLAHASRVSESALASLGFKCRRKRFSIETIHLPPEGETASRSNEEDSKHQTRKRHGNQPQKNVHHDHGNIDF